MNGKAFGLFQSSRGLKEGDPFSHTLSIIAIEVLTRILNCSFEHCDFKGFGMRKWSSQINHLSYVDDTILFLLRTTQVNENEDDCAKNICGGVWTNDIHRQKHLLST